MSRVELAFQAFGLDDPADQKELGKVLDLELKLS
jgi:hypothetical protein